MSTINVNIHQIRNLDFDGDVILKLELGDKVLGESDRITIIPDSFVNVEFSATYSFDQADYNSIDELVSSPLICSVVEGSLKEKIDDAKETKTDEKKDKSKIKNDDKKNNKKEDNKKGDNKLVIMAQCSLEMQQFFLGETFARSSFQLQPFVGSSFEQNPNSLKAEIDISICCDGPLVSEEDLRSGNLLRITVESLMSLPESWEPSGQNFTYVAACSIPRTGQEDTLGIFPDGKFLKPSEDREVHDNRKKWPLPGSAVGGAAYIRNRTLGTEKYFEESGDLKRCENFEFRKFAYKCKPRVQWNMERNFYLGKEAVERLKCYILQTRYLAIEIYRFPLDAKGDDEAISFHGVSYIDVTPFVHPGGTRIRGAYIITGFNEDEFLNKTKQSKSVAEDSKKFVGEHLSMASSDLKVTSPKKDDVKDKKTEKKSKNKNVNNTNKGQSPKAEEKIELSEEDKNKKEGEEFAKATSHVMVEVTLDRPFYPKKTAEEALLSVSSIIPQRPLYPKKTNTSEKAIADYQSKIISIASLLLDEFEKHFEPDDSAVSNEDSFEMKRQKFLYHLNSSGKYLAFKEQMRHAVVKIVRDTFCRMSIFECQEEFQCFLSDLYTMLVDEMHSSLLKFIASEEKPEQIQVNLTDDQLKHFAQEADLVEKHCLAEKYYFERISQDRRNPEFWFDAGCHYMLVEDFNRAGECFKECVAVSKEHVNGLIMSGVCHVYRDCMGAAECLFDAATAVEPSNILAWAMLGLFYDYINNAIMFERCINEAHCLALQRPEYICICCQETKKQEEAPAVIDASVDQKESKQRKPLKKGDSEKLQAPRKEILPLPEPEILVKLKDSLFVDAVTFLTNSNELVFREKALTKHAEDIYGGFNFSYYREMSRLYTTKKLYCEAEQFIDIAISLCMQDPRVWTIFGHLKYLSGDFKEAICCYDRRISYNVEDQDLHFVYLRLGAAYMYESKFQDAKQTYLAACKKKPTCLTWLGAGMSCYRLSQLKEAEEALIEANFLNNEDSEVWAYLCLISMQKCRHFEAKQAYKYALRAGLRNADLCNEIMQVQQASGISLN